MPHAQWEVVIPAAIRALLDRVSGRSTKRIGRKIAPRSRRLRSSEIELHQAESLEPRYLLSTPTVLSINRAAPATAFTSVNNVSFNVTFSTPVNGVDQTDFKVSLAGNVVTTPPIVVNGSGATRTVFVSGIHGNGDVRLDLVDNDSITSIDTATPLGGAGTGNGSFQGQAFNFLQTGARILSIDRTSPAGPNTISTSVVFTATFSATVIGVDASDFQLALAGVTTSPPVVTGTGSVYTITVGGITGAGTVGLNLVDDGTIHDANGNPLQLSTASFQSKPALTLTTKPSAAIAADLNGDGKQDLVSANRFSSNVLVMLGNGNGTFGAAVPYTTDVVPRSVAAADVNGDGRLDLITGNLGTSTTTATVSVLLGNGNGTFQNQTSYPVGAGPLSVVAGDLNADGKADIVVANSGGSTVSVLLGNGNGTFQSQTTFATGTNPHSVCIADVNGDGRPDLMAANYVGNTVSVLLGNGNGTFQPQTTFTTNGESSSVITAELTGDNKPDLIVANALSGNVSVLLGNGDGSFQNKVDYQAGTGPNSVIAADVNGDGKNDLLVANFAGSTGTVLLGNGNGTFQTQVPFATGTSPYSVVTADLNGDGRPDLVTANSDSSNLSILLGGSASFTGQVYTIVVPAVQSITRASPVGPYTSATSVIYTVTLNTPVTGVDASDFKLFLSDTLKAAGAVTVTGSGATRTVTIDNIHGSGDFRLDLIDNDSIISVSNPLPIGGLSIANGSFQGQTYSILQGGPQVLSINRTTPAYPSTGAHSVVYTVTFNGNVTGVDASDFKLALIGVTASTPVVTGSGSVYTVTINGITGVGTLGLNLINDGTIHDAAGNLLASSVASMQNQNTFATGTTPASVATADVNGDDNTDLIVANQANNNLSVLLGNGNGTFQNQTTFAVGTQPRSVAVSDVNGDGKPDLIAANRLDSTVSVLLGNGNGTFQTQTTFDTGKAPLAVITSDVNGDGKPDLVVVNNNNNNVGILLGNGDGTFKPQTTFAAGSFPYSVAASDLNGDGKPDLIVGDFLGGGGTSILLGNGDGSFQSPLAVSTGSSVVSVTSADVNGDGKADMIVANSDAGAVGVSLGNGSGTFQTQKQNNTGFGLNWISVADVNGDGKLDLLAVNETDNALRVFLGNGDGTFQSPAVFASGVKPVFVTSADLNADGKIDSIVANATDNNVGVLLGAGGFTGQVYNILVPNVVSIARATPPGLVTNAASVVYTVTFNTDVIGEDAADFQVFHNGTVSALSPVVVSGSGSVYTVTINGISGSGDLRLDLVDNDSITESGTPIGGTGVNNGSLQGPKYLIVQTAPQVISINRTTPAGPITSATSVTYTVNFNTAVTGVDASDFRVILAGSLQATTPVLVSGSGATRTVTINGIHGNGDLRLELIDDDSIVASGVPLAATGLGTGSFTGQTYTVYQPGPKVLSINRTTPAGPGNIGAGSVIYTVTFSENVTGVDIADFQTALSGVTASLPVVTGSGNVYTVTINGISGAGTLGLNLIDNGTIHDSAGNVLQGSAAALQNQTTINTGSFPDALVTSDLNGDGNPDLVAANKLSNNVGVFLGAGNGTFSLQTTFATGSLPDAVTAADVNGDGKPDLIAANNGGSSVSVLIGNGDGTFQGQVSYPVGTNPVSIYAADLNGDGRPDLITRNKVGVSVLLGNGDGTFQPQTIFPGAVITGPSALADLNGDGNLDLAFSTIGFMGILFGVGDRTFSTATFFNIGTTPATIATGDMNGDAKTDLIVGNGDTRTVGVLLGTGNGSFQTQTLNFANDFPIALSVADMNGDGLPDIVVASVNTNTTGVLLGKGDGTLQTQVPFNTGTGPVALAIADSNGDGRPDIMVANQGTAAAPGNTVSLLLGNAKGNFTGQVYSIAPAPFNVIESSFNYLTKQSIVVTFNKDVSATLAASDLILQNLTTNTTIPAASISLNYSTLTATFTFSGILADGNYHAKIIANTVKDPQGNSLPADFSLDFFVLDGDSDRDRSVGFSDLVAIAQHYGAIAGNTFATGDFNYDGNVDFTDLVTLAQRYGTTLAPIPAASIVAAASALTPPKPAITKPAPPAPPINSLLSVIPIGKPTPSKTKPRIPLRR